MKTQRNLPKSGLVLVLLALIGLVGCSGDKDDNPLGSDEGSIVGAWNLTAIQSTDGNQTIQIPPQEIKEDPLLYQINGDGSGVQNYQNRQTKFTWTESGNKLYFNSNVESNSYTFTVNSRTLTLTFPVEQYTITHTFTRQ